MLIDFELTVDTGTRRFEVHTLVDQADAGKIESLFSAKFDQLDDIVKAVYEEIPDVARIVIDWRDDAMHLRYVVRQDGVPLAPDDNRNLTLDKAIEQLRDVPAFSRSSIGGGIRGRRHTRNSSPKRERENAAEQE